MSKEKYNALVRANYHNVPKNIDYAPEFLVRFFQNLLYGGQWQLSSRYLHIAPTAEWRQQPNRRANASGGNDPEFVEQYPDFFAPENEDII